MKNKEKTQRHLLSLEVKKWRGREKVEEIEKRKKKKLNWKDSTQYTLRTFLCQRGEAVYRLS